MTIENKKLRNVLRALYVSAILFSLILSTTVMMASFEAAFGRMTHDRFWQSRKFYHDGITDECYMILVDRFGRGVAAVPCNKIPVELLRHLDEHRHAMR